MKKKRLKKLALNVKTISNLQSHTLKGGETCESPCQGGTGCCYAATDDEDEAIHNGTKYNCLLYWFYYHKLKQ